MITCPPQSETQGSGPVRPLQRGLMPVVPTRAGGYRLIARIGQGGMGETFLAVDEHVKGVQKLVVIKLLHAHLHHDPASVRAFLEEGRVALCMGHSSIVRTLNVGEHDGRHYLVMEFLHGQTLQAMVEHAWGRHERLPLGVAVRIVADALEGLHYMHQAEGLDGKPLGLVHRDVCPRNLFVTYHGETKLLDFGISKSALPPASTQAALLKGKLCYLPPELASGEWPDVRSDVWSMGVVLWEAICGRRLFDGASEVATLQQILNMPIEDAYPEGVEIPEALHRAVSRALARDPAERFESAAAMRDDLGEWLGRQSRSGSRGAVGEYLRERFGEVRAEDHSVIREQLAGARVPLDLSVSIAPPLPRRGDVPPEPHDEPAGPVTGAAENIEPVALGASKRSVPAPHPIANVEEAEPTAAAKQEAAAARAIPLSEDELLEELEDVDAILEDVEEVDDEALEEVPAADRGADLDRISSPASVPAGETDASRKVPAGKQAGAAREGVAPTGRAAGPSPAGPVRTLPPPAEQPARERLAWAVAAALLLVVLLLLIFRPVDPGPWRAGAQEAEASEAESAPVEANPLPALPAAAPGQTPTRGTSMVVEPLAPSPSAAEAASAPEGEEVEAIDAVERKGRSREERESASRDRGDDSKRSARRRRRKAEKESAAEQSSTSAEGKAHEPPRFGFLTLDTKPWSMVSLNGRSLGQTPVVKARLPAGEHELSLTNETFGIEATYRVTIEPDATVRKRLAID